MAEDYYQILGVSRSASADEIQKAYRKLARKFHPDLHADKEDREREKAKQQFQKVQQAYDVLSDPQKREMFDQFGPGYEQMAGAGGNPYGQSAGAEVDLGDLFRGAGGRGGPGGGFGGFEDILRQMGGAMGGGRGQRPRNQPPPPQRGSDIDQEITVPFAVAVLGGNHQVQLRRKGKVESFDVKIPAGIENAKKIRLRGQGHESPNGGEPGDLLVTVKIAKHPSFTRSGLNLAVTVPITLLEAASGAKVDLPTPHGTVTLTIPSGCSSGKNLRLKGLGIKTKEKSGDLIATVQIEIPDEIASQDLETLKQLSADWNRPVRDHLSW